MPRLDLRPTGAGLDERREELLDAAARLFAERGYHSTTMEDVVGAAGVAKGTLYWYYRSKKALFLAVLERASSGFRAELVRRVGRIASPLERLRTAVDAAVRLAGAHPDIYRLYFQQVWDGDEGFVRERERIYSQIRDDLRGTLCEAMDAGELRRGDAELYARMITGALEAATGYAVDRGPRAAPAKQVTRFVMGGLTSGPA